MEAGQPKLIKGLQAEYVPATYPGKSVSGLKPFGKNLLIAVDECAETTSGGVLLTQDMTEKMTEGATSGCIFAIAPECFRLFDDGTRWEGDAPKVGDRVVFEKYAGVLQRGVDGKPYRFMDYRAIGGGIDEAYLNSINVEVQPIAKAS